MRVDTVNKKLLNKDFILLLQGAAVSTIGDLMYSVAIGYWVYEQTGSSGLMGIMSAISLFVTMFLSPFSGSIVDKCNRKWVLVGMDLLQSVIMLTIGMYYMVSHWNTYMAAVLYVTDQDLQPMQVILRRLLESSTAEVSVDVVVPTETMRMAAVCFATLPIVVVYPFIQKYFVKGTLAGAVKG